jgi:hypothetical protein
MRRKYKQPKKSKTTAWALPNLYGQGGGKKKKKKNVKKVKTKKPLQAEEDPWARLERLQLEAEEFDKAKAYVEGLPTPDLPSSYEANYLKATQGFGYFEEGHFEAQRKDKQKAKNKFVGPPSVDDMMSGPMAAYGAPKSIMESLAKENPLGTAMVYEKISKEFPQEWEGAKATYPSAAKYQKDKEAYMMKNKKKSSASTDDIMKLQRDAVVVDNIKNKLGMAYGGKMRYQTGGPVDPKKKKKKMSKKLEDIPYGYTKTLDQMFPQGYGYMKTIESNIPPGQFPEGYGYTKTISSMNQGKSYKKELNRLFPEGTGYTKTTSQYLSSPFDVDPNLNMWSPRNPRMYDDFSSMENTEDNSINTAEYRKAGKRRALRSNQVAPMQAQSVGMQSGGKMKYNMAGMLPGAIQGMMGTAAMTTQGGFKNMPWQHTAGRIMQGASGLANLIPGAGPLVGMGMNLVGGALQTMAPPTMTNPESINQNPLGMQMGGQAPTGQQDPMGGEMKPLSNSAVEVQANNPQMTDSVDAGPVMLDDKEVVVNKKVFSNTLINPQSGMTFAEQEKETQKQQGRFEKYKVATGDTEMKDGKFHKMNTERLFNTQENVATQLGLRNEDGTPKQIMPGPENQFMFGGDTQLFHKFGTNGPAKQLMATGGKIGYYTGGGFSPGPGDEDRGTVQAIMDSLMGAKSPYNAPPPADTGTAFTAETGQPDQYGQNPNISNSYAANLEEQARLDRFLYPQAHNADGSRFAGDTYGGAQGSAGLPGTETPMPSNFGTPGPGPGIVKPDGPLYPINTGLEGINFPTAQRQLRSGQVAPISIGIDPTGGGLKSNNQDAPPSLQDDNDITKADVTKNTNPALSGQNDMADILKQYNEQNPYGERATQMGDMITSMGLMANRPFYVNYGDVGREEINQQNIALARARGGEQAAINDVLAQEKAARQRAGGRSFQTMQANLANLSSRTGQALAKTRGQFGRQEAQMRQQIGARRTGIEQANLQTQMRQDDINTREYDTLWKENLKNLTNYRNMQLERQFAFNKFRRNEDLKAMLQSKNFKWDEASKNFILKEIFKSGNNG